MLCLTKPTPAAWVSIAIADLPALLVDHAHCEMKAVSNALAIANRWSQNATLVRAMVAIAQEELEHFQRVVALLGARGVLLGTPKKDAYVARLRAEVARSGHGVEEDRLVDRLLIAALIEARSCERFSLLSRGLVAVDENSLCRFYEELFAVEARHYRTFVDLAEEAGGAERVRNRFNTLCELEGRLTLEFGNQPTMHG